MIEQFGSSPVDLATSTEVIRSCGHILGEGFSERDPIGNLESTVVEFFVPNSAASFRAHGTSAQRPCPMGGVDFAKVGECEELRVKAIVEAGRKLFGSSGKQIGSSHVTHEQRVPTEYTRWLSSAIGIFHHI